MLHDPTPRAPQVAEVDLREFLAPTTVACCENSARAIAYARARWPDLKWAYGWSYYENSDRAWGDRKDRFHCLHRAAEKYDVAAEFGPSSREEAYLCSKEDRSRAADAIRSHRTSCSEKRRFAFYVDRPRPETIRLVLSMNPADAAFFLGYGDSTVAVAAFTSEPPAALLSPGDVVVKKRMLRPESNHGRCHVVEAVADRVDPSLFADEVQAIIDEEDVAQAKSDAERDERYPHRFFPTPRMSEWEITQELRCNLDEADHLREDAAFFVTTAGLTMLRLKDSPLAGYILGDFHIIKSSVATVTKELGRGGREDFLAIKFDYDAEFVKIVKKVPGRQWNSGDFQWEIPLSSLPDLREAVAKMESLAEKQLSNA